MDEEIKDPFIGVFDIHFNGPRKMSAENTRIVHWRWGGDGMLMYLISEDGDIYNFHHINMMIRIGD